MTASRSIRLPSFVIAGERRCGTTTLARWLAAHEDVFVLPQMDIAYFVDDEVVGCREWFDGDVVEARWKQTHDPHRYAQLFVGAANNQVTGEKSADYLFWRPAHARIAECLPNAKLVVILRNPIERAWSHYWNEVGKGRETLSFEAALVQEDERCARSAYARDHLSYRTRGFYDESLRDLFRHISRDRVFVTTLEQLHEHSLDTLRAVYEFLGVDPNKGIQRTEKHFNANWTTIPSGWARIPGVRVLEKSCVSGIEWMSRKIIRDLERRRRYVRRVLSVFRYTKSDLRMEEATRAELAQAYAPHIAALESLLDRSFDEWQFRP